MSACKEHIEEKKVVKEDNVEKVSNPQSKRQQKIYSLGKKAATYNVGKILIGAGVENLP